MTVTFRGPLLRLPPRDRVRIVPSVLLFGLRPRVAFTGSDAAAAPDNSGFDICQAARMKHAPGAPLQSATALLAARLGKMLPTRRISAPMPFSFSSMFS
jgi:hypothetical protein